MAGPARAREARDSTCAWDPVPNLDWDPQDSRTPSQSAIASARECAPIFS
jgi:hypothetical protein